MDDSITAIKRNQPRVFLSHSDLDKPFIEKLCNDLRRCQIYPWLDAVEIRDGKPWLKEIFENGIPTCDAILIYFTSNALNSKMVEKEIDSALIQQLNDNNISLLPYVDSKITRSKLRSDIKALHCRELNNENYLETLPSIIAQIWSSYNERSINIALLNERNKRLEAELHLFETTKKLDSSIFSLSEEKDFKYILTSLNRDFIFNLQLCQIKDKGIYDLKENREILGYETFKINMLLLVTLIITSNIEPLNNLSLKKAIRNVLEVQGLPNQLSDKRRFYDQFLYNDNLFLFLKTYGLITGSFKEKNLWGMDTSSHNLSDKMYRFFYWLGYNNYAYEDPIKFTQIESNLYDMDENSPDSDQAN